MVKGVKVTKTAAKSPARKKVEKVPVAIPVEKRDRFDWRSLYLYAVSLITLLVCLFAIVSVIRNGVSFVYPDPGYFDPNSPANKAGAELARQYQLNQSHRNSVIGMVNGLAMFIVAAPLYFYHWRMVRADSKH